MKTFVVPGVGIRGSPLSTLKIVTQGPQIHSDICCNVQYEPISNLAKIDEPDVVGARIRTLYCWFSSE